MFQFRAFPSYGYLIHRTILEYCSSVLPHSEISGSQLICSSPKLFAACHVLHRLLMPRHSPCALISLTYVEENFAPLRPPSGEHPVCSVSSSSPPRTRLRWASRRFKRQNLCFLRLKCFPQCCFLSAILRSRPLLPCFYICSLCSVFKVQCRSCDRWWRIAGSNR